MLHFLALYGSSLLIAILFFVIIFFLDDLSS